MQWSRIRVVLSSASQFLLLFSIDDLIGCFFGVNSEGEEDSEPPEDVDEFIEVRFVPPTEENLEVLFSVFSKGAQMNPDPVEGMTIFSLLNCFHIF
jgi:hypothetical protein